MRNESGRTDPIWPDTVDMPEFPALEDEIETEVCVIGAGIAGMTTAYLLAREGVRVVVVDDGPVGGGETGRTTAHLANAIDDGIALIEEMYGEEGARAAVESHGAAIDRIESIVDEEGIDCAFQRVNGYLLLSSGDSREALSDELQAAHRSGWKDVTWVEPPLETVRGRACLRFPRQAQFNPLRFLAGLARAIERDGGKIFTRSHVGEVKRGAPVQVVTNTGGRIRAERVVAATNSPVVETVAIHTKQAPYRTYVVGLEVPTGSVPFGLYWDTADPYHYVRLERPEVDSEVDSEVDRQEVDTEVESDSARTPAVEAAAATDAAGAAATNILIVGGEDHKTGQADDGAARFDRLEAWARELFPSSGKVTYRWSGQVLEPVDGVAFIGRAPGYENVYFITGDSGQGMTHGVLGGMILCDLIRGRENPWAEFYSPTRKPLKRHSGIEWVRENLNVARRYTERVRGGAADAAAEIPFDSGAVIRRDGKHVAVYRDGTGSLHECSAICTHMKCVVHWNSTEGSWDCPCHGSRFDPFGKVLNGPALRELTPVGAPAEVSGE